MTLIGRKYALSKNAALRSFICWESYHKTVCTDRGLLIGSGGTHFPLLAQVRHSQ
jgi:hypothetical protein